MNHIFIILNTSAYAAGKPSRSAFDVAYARRDEAFAAIAEDIALSLREGVITEAFTVVPAPVFDGEDCRFAEDDIRRCQCVEIYRPRPDGVPPEDDDRVGCYRIREMRIEDDSLVSLTKEHLYESGRRLLEALRNGRHDYWNPARVDAVLGRWTDSNGTLFDNEFCVESLYYAGNTPMARGRWENGEEDVVELTDKDVAEKDAARESFWWNEEGLSGLADRVAEMRGPGEEV